MAHPNIDKRRLTIKELLDNEVIFTPKLKMSLMKEFNCSIGAITADLLMLLRPKSKESYFVCTSLKKRIYKRDGKDCQYCSDKKAYEYIVEHVIPASLGGIARDFNLVIACQKCNTKKRNRVWKPKNFQVLVDLNKEWANKIEILASRVLPQTREKINTDRGGMSVGKFFDKIILKKGD